MNDSKNKRGPKPDTFKTKEDWKKTVKGALKKKRLAEGWPKQKKWARTPKIKMPPR